MYLRSWNPPIHQCIDHLLWIKLSRNPPSRDTSRDLNKSVDLSFQSLVGTSSAIPWGKSPITGYSIVYLVKDAARLSQLVINVSLTCQESPYIRMKTYGPSPTSVLSVFLCTPPMSYRPTRTLVAV